ncbi:glycoside hydrolase family 2 protein [Paramyrothecium foliicola]|nr:glycoside hydrolase family 2 protein [Paramyrothecium foliicola]
MLRSQHQLSDGWKVRQADDSAEEAWLPARDIPTQIHLDLLANEKIPDPFLDLNELAVRWVSEKGWVYRRHFQNPATLETQEPVVTDLVFEGLDTFATVFLNGVEILRSDNMFLSHRVDVSKHLKDENTLEIVFDSTVLRGRQLLEEHSHEHTFYVRQTEASRVPVRSAQYNWGWDWGPIMLTMGPWKPIYLDRYVARVDDVWVQYELDADLDHVSGTVFAAVTGSGVSSAKLSISLDGVSLCEEECSVDSNGLSQMQFHIHGLRLWNPFGYGEQTRYQVKAAIGSLDEKSRHVGFRRAELIQEPDEYGKSFFFRINGIDVFCGGSCWIPADSFLSRMTPERYHDWMRLMVEGNQNMVRIWGGGIYEHDALYDACDELGILVWQDFGFACASYPAYPSYLASVEAEARQNLRRLRSHPSLVIWAGNNEDYQVQERYKLEYNYEDKDPQSWLKSTFPARYLYEYLLPKIVSEEDPAVVYHPSSPWGDGKHTADPTVGDKHQWDLWHGAMFRYQEAPTLSARFISEFGMEAYPHLETIRGMILDPREHHPGSKMMDFRNKAIDHERRMITYVAENFRIKYDLASFTHLTQIVQAETMTYAYESWRREWGSRKCGGVLVWQLNDCWPTMSWAVVDYHLVKKPAFYAIARAMKPLAVGISRKHHSWTAGHDDPTASSRDIKFDVWIASSLLEPTQVDVNIRFISIKTGEDLTSPIRLTSVARPNDTTEILKEHSGPDASAESCGSREQFDLDRYNPYVIHVTVVAEDKVVATNTSWPQPIKYLDLGPRKIDFQAASSTSIAISSKHPIKGFVFQEDKSTRFSDNGFDLVPGEKTVITVQGVDLSSLKYTYIGGQESVTSI